LLHKTSLYSGVRVGKAPYLHAASEYTPTVAKKVETETFFIGILMAFIDDLDVE